jgi:hypothetical protein
MRLTQDNEIVQTLAFQRSRSTSAIAAAALWQPHDQSPTLKTPIHERKLTLEELRKRGI